VDNLTVIIHLARITPDLLKILAKPYFAILEPGTNAGTGAYVISTKNDSGLMLTPRASYWGDVPANNLEFVWK